MRKVILLLLLLLLLSYSCKQNPPEPTELYDKYRNSVVLIQNSYYFKTSLDNGFEFFYTIENNKPVFFEDEAEAIVNAGVSYGTGFFISDKGELATNRHVVYPNREDKLVGEGINEYLNDLRYKIKKAVNEKQTEQSKLVDLWNEYYDYYDYEKKTQIKDDFSNKKNDVLELEQMLEKLDFNPNNTITELKRVFLGVAYDDTHITSINDFKECVIIKKANNNDIDLAIIQLKDKTTPQNILNTFSLEIRGKDGFPKLNDNVYMIGFNHGMSLANTDNGIKSQFTQGTITQDPDNKRILYSIPTLPGSSGSPIIDKWGNLVAINFAKTGDFQGFSFGIPSLSLTNLYNGNLESSLENESWVVTTSKPKIENEIDHKEEQIGNFNKTETAQKEATLSYLNGGFETQIILEYNYNSYTKSYDLKNELQLPSKLYFDNISYSFKRGNNSWLTANWTYSRYDVKTETHIFFDNYGQTLVFDQNFKTLTWYTKRGENNIFQEIITYKTLIPNNTIKPNSTYTEKFNNSYVQPKSNDQKSSNFKDSEYKGYYKFATTFDNPPFEMSLYSEPNVNSEVKYICPKNATVYIIDNSGKIFYKAYLNGYTGYLSKWFLKRKN